MPRDRLYREWLDCYRSGQMSAHDLHARMREDPAFAAFVTEDVRKRAA